MGGNGKRKFQVGERLTGSGIGPIGTIHFHSGFSKGLFTPQKPISVHTNIFTLIIWDLEADIFVKLDKNCGIKD